MNQVAFNPAPNSINTKVERRLKFQPSLRENTRKAFQVTHFSPVKAIVLTGSEAAHGIEPQVTSSLKFGERLDFVSLLDSRFDALKKMGFDTLTLTRPVRLSKLYLEGNGILVELELNEILSSKSITIRDKDGMLHPCISLKGFAQGRFDSSIRAFSTTYWNRNHQPIFELDITVNFTASTEYGLGTVMATGVATFAGMKRISTSGVNMPQQLSDHFFNVKPRAFDLDVDISAAYEN